jgi:hypothetical protein
MLNGSPFKCNYCGKLKEQSNHWWLRPITPSFILEPWEDRNAAKPDIENICSETCAVKALSKWMGAQ